MIVRPCAYCGVRPSRPIHHRWPQHRDRVRHYGRKMIDAEFNMAWCCHVCNGSHDNVELWSEDEFRAAAERAGFVLPPPMRSNKKAPM